MMGSPIPLRRSSAWSSTPLGRDVLVSGEKDDGQPDFPAPQFGLELDTAHAGHLHIKDQATGHARAQGGNKRLRAGELRHRVTGGPEHVSQYAADELVIVDKKDCRSAHLHNPSFQPVRSPRTRAAAHVPPDNFPRVRTCLEPD